MSKTIIEYPAGSYECTQCGEMVLVIEAATTPPSCTRCGGQKYKGITLKIVKQEPEVPKLYEAGMYECEACGDRTAISEATDELPDCGMCGAHKLKPLE